MPPHLLDHSPADLERRLLDWGEPPFRARQAARWALRGGATSFEQMTNLPTALRARLAEESTLAPPPVLAETSSDDGATTKVLLDLGEGAAVEAVRMDYDPDRPHHPGGTRARSTVCVSTQVGCAMACVFCATGQQGFTRNLGAGEILAQVLHFQRKRPVSNVVFMGMGEPLANYGPTLTAVRWLIDRDGLDLRARGVTISTVGLPPAIRRLAAEGLQIGLAVSLHAPDDELRRRLIPTAGGVTLDELIDASQDYVERTGRRVSFAYALLEGLNDDPEQGPPARAAHPRHPLPRQPDPLQPDRRRGLAPSLARPRPRFPARAAGGGRQRHRPHRARRRDRRRLRPAPQRLRHERGGQHHPLERPERSGLTPCAYSEPIRERGQGGRPPMRAPRSTGRASAWRCVGSLAPGPPGCDGGLAT